MRDPAGPFTSLILNETTTHTKYQDPEMSKPPKAASNVVLLSMVASGCALLYVDSLYAQTVAPTAGTIFREIQAEQSLPTTQGRLINLPSPGDQFDQESTPINITRFVIEGASLISAQDLGALLADLPSESATLAVINEAMRRVTNHYQTKGYALAFAYVPPQTVDGGVVTLRVVEPRYDHIELEESSRLRPEQALRTVGVKSGEPVEQDQLDRGLLLLNQTPGVQAEGILVPGSQPATTSLRLRIHDLPIFSGSVSANNHGSAATGQARTQFNAAINNPFGYGSQISLNGARTESGLLQSTGVTYLSGDLNDGLRASLYGQKSSYRLGGDFAALDQTGWTEQLGASLDYPIILTPSQVLNLKLDAVEARYTSTSSTLDSAAHTDMLRIALAGAMTDTVGTGSTSGNLTLTLGNQFNDSEQSRESDEAGANTAGNFQVLQFKIQRNQPLPHSQWVLQAGISGQLASKNLDPSQKFYLGGPFGVMSAPNSELSGDQGAILRVRLAHPLPLPEKDSGRLEAGLLMQIGAVQINRDPFEGSAENNWQSLSAGGLELQYTLDDRLAVQLQYAHRVSGSVSSDEIQPESLWLSIRYNF